MTYFIVDEKRNGYQVFLDAKIVCRSPKWSDIIDFLKVQYKQNGNQPLDIKPTNIYDNAKLAGLDGLITKMSVKKI